MYRKSDTDGEGWELPASVWLLEKWWDAFMSSVITFFGPEGESEKHCEFFLKVNKCVRETWLIGKWEDAMRVDG